MVALRQEAYGVDDVCLGFEFVGGQEEGFVFYQDADDVCLG